MSAPPLLWVVDDALPLSPVLRRRGVLREDLSALAQHGLKEGGQPRFRQHPLQWLVGRRPGAQHDFIHDIWGSGGEWLKRQSAEGEERGAVPDRGPSREKPTEAA